MGLAPDNFWFRKKSEDYEWVESLKAPLMSEMNGLFLLIEKTWV
jgi:hypothetical protein